MKSRIQLKNTLNLVLKKLTSQQRNKLTWENWRTNKMAIDAAQFKDKTFALEYIKNAGDNPNDLQRKFIEDEVQVNLMELVLNLASWCRGGTSAVSSPTPSTTPTAKL